MGVIPVRGDPALGGAPPSASAPTVAPDPVDVDFVTGEQEQQGEPDVAKEGDQRSHLQPKNSAVPEPLVRAWSVSRYPQSTRGRVMMVDAAGQFEVEVVGHSVGRSEA